MDCYGNIKIEKPLNGASLPFITKKELLSKVSEYQIYAYYIGDDFTLGKPMSSPLRTDNNPSFSVFQTNSGLRYKDHSTAETGDVFHFVGDMFNLSFSDVILKISNDFGIIKVNSLKSIPRTRGFVSTITPRVQYSKEISIKRRYWNSVDKEYWSKYGITSKLLNKYKVFPVERAYIGLIMYYSYNKNNPCYAYMEKKDDKYTFKLYQPYASKNKKWRSNVDSSVLQGWSQLPDEGENLVITKSLKDVMVFNTIGYPSVAMQSEVSSIKESVMIELYNRFENIYLLQDYDKAGIVGTYSLTREYPFLKWFFIQNKKTCNNGLKDISDFRASSTIENTKRLIDFNLNQWKIKMK